MIKVDDQVLKLSIVIGVVVVVLLNLSLLIMMQQSLAVRPSDVLRKLEDIESKHADFVAEYRTARDYYAEKYREKNGDRQ